MELNAPTSRPSTVRPFGLLVAGLVAGLVLPLGLAGCGSDDGERGTSPMGRSSPSSRTASATPTTSPTVGSYPDFPATDYTYQLGVQCFCAFAGSPVEVTVTSGKVVTAVYAHRNGGRQDVKGGDPAPGWMRLTINDVIAEANDTTADRVTVDWPAGQEYPNSVFVDAHKDMADDEVGYTIQDVRVR
jgi:major membrane immunogen (membrane-anchored lipoprotein)